MAKVNFNCAQLTANSNIKVGDVLISKGTIGSATKVKITKVTPTMVWVGETCYKRAGGYLKCDEYKRPCLFLLTEETVKA